MAETTADKLLAIVRNHAPSLIPEAENFVQREKWIEEATDWLDDRAERESIKAEARAASIGKVSFGKIP